MSKIKVNAVYCTLCQTYVRSHTRHDFRWCQCGNVAVDGGRDYLKRVFKDKDGFEERSEYTE